MAGSSRFDGAGHDLRIDALFDRAGDGPAAITIPIVELFGTEDRGAQRLTIKQYDERLQQFIVSGCTTWTRLARVDCRTGSVTQITHVDDDAHVRHAEGILARAASWPLQIRADGFLYGHVLVIKDTQRQVTLATIDDGTPRDADIDETTGEIVCAGRASGSPGTRLVLVRRNLRDPRSGHGRDPAGGSHDANHDGATAR